jgi:hypothetical protein
MVNSQWSMVVDGRRWSIAAVLFDFESFVYRLQNSGRNAK